MFSSNSQPSFPSALTSKKVITNIELLRAKIARMHSYGIIVDDTQLAFILLANVKLATSKAWGREFCPALQTIRRADTYNHAHTSNSITTILRELARTDGVHKLNVAPAAIRWFSQRHHQPNLLLDHLAPTTAH
jgi:hypothetical protein